MQKKQSPKMKTDSLNVRMHLFWEFDHSRIDWQLHAVGIIERVLERGNHQEWEELLRFYGRRKIIYSLKHKITYLIDEVITDVCAYFKIDVKELRCYESKRSRPGHWL